jgi:hypothetical protein
MLPIEEPTDAVGTIDKSSGNAVIGTATQDLQNIYDAWQPLVDNVKAVVAVITVASEVKLSS